jgi:DNA-binding NtrC family response regulator
VAVVLIVEDEAHVRLCAELIVQDAGHETRSAGTVGQAKAIIGSGDRIDLLFTDLRLLDDREAGLEVARSAAQARPGLPVVYTTSRGITDGMIAEFVQPSVFLRKPYTDGQLMNAVSSLLRLG